MQQLNVSILLTACAAAAPLLRAGEAAFSAFGIFDGHGGRQAATYASNFLLKGVLAEADAPGPPPPEVPELEGLSPEDRAAWALQAALMARLPAACHAAFVRCNEEATRRFRAGGGTTATLAVSCGWELVVANVGDSCAYLDTGTEVLTVCGNHRLEDNPAEQRRILDSGGEIGASIVDGEEERMASRGPAAGAGATAGAVSEAVVLP